jgi:alkanesulfonate monooxygenase SsuD/methylene tetrahydromethanopterin reductase-like flavin-dependent oxidoreductase (luciferase family)
VEGCTQGGRVANPRDWRVVRSIFVGDDDAKAQRFARDRNGPHGFYYWSLLQKRKALGGIAAFKHDPAVPDQAVSPDYLMEHMVIAGGVERVVNEILALRETLGPFGTLLYCGHDWVDPVLAKRSMVLMAEEVMPRVNRALGET